MYHLHPDPVLNDLFSSRPYQGANPMDAKYVFIGLDANYGKDIQQSGIFTELVEYLKDGVSFWNKYSVHHPFLLPAYTGDGKFYHKSFSKIGFQKEQAEIISFIELLHLPTFGRSKLKPEELKHSHMCYLNRIILEGNAEYIFVPTNVGNLMRATGEFSWLPGKPKDTGDALKLWYGKNNKKVLWHYHFSVYGKFQELKTKQRKEIGALIQ